MKYLYKLLQQHSILFSILVATLFLQNCKGDNEKIKEEPKENISAQIEEYKNLLDRATKGDAQSQFLLAKKLYRRFKNQKPDGPLDPRNKIQEKIMLWLYKSAFKGYEPAAHFLLNKLGLSVNIVQSTNVNLACMHDATCIDKSSHHTNEIVPYVGPMFPPLLLLYQYDDPKNQVPIDEFQSYCTNLFCFIYTSSENYQVKAGYLSDVLNYIRRVSQRIQKKDSINPSDYIEGSEYIISVCRIASECIENICEAKNFEVFQETYKIELVNKLCNLLGYSGVANLDLISHLIQQRRLDSNFSKCLENHSKIRQKLRETSCLIPKELLEIDHLKDIDNIFEARKTHQPNFANCVKQSLPQGALLGKNRKKQPGARMLSYSGKKIIEQVQLHEIPDDMEILQKEIKKLDAHIKEIVDKNLISEKNLTKDLENALKRANRSFLEAEKVFFSINYSIKHITGDESKDFPLGGKLIFDSSRKKEPTFDNLIKLHEFFSYLSKKMERDVDKYLYSLMTKGVTLLSFANNFKQALLRLQVMEEFYSKAGYYPDNFKYFVAFSYAKCGQYDKLSKLYQEVIDKKLAHQNRLRKKHQKKIELIKEVQLAQMALPAAKLDPVESTTLDRLQRVDDMPTPIESELVSKVAYQEEMLRRKAEAEARMKRHQQAEEERSKRKLLVDELGQENERELPTLIPFDERKEKEDKGKEKEELSMSQVEEIETEVSSAHFSLSSKAYATVNRIFDNNWKINRKDIEHLFNELGHTINIATKSSHHIVQIPCGITLVNENGKITHIIADLSAQAGGHLSLPSWQDLVPVYMRSQITNLLSAIGLHAENYSKINSSEHVQFVSVENSTSDPSTTSTTKTNKKRNKGKEKEKNY